MVEYRLPFWPTGNNPKSYELFSDLVAKHNAGTLLQPSFNLTPISQYRQFAA
jgi:hypothetical protein